MTPYSSVLLTDLYQLSMVQAYVEQEMMDTAVFEFFVIKKERNTTKVKETLAVLKKAAQGTDNVVPPILEAVRVYATLGEISDTLREVFGEYRER